MGRCVETLWIRKTGSATMIKRTAFVGSNWTLNRDQPARILCISHVNTQALIYFLTRSNATRMLGSHTHHIISHHINNPSPNSLLASRSHRPANDTHSPSQSINQPINSPSTHRLPQQSSPLTCAHNAVRHAGADIEFRSSPQ